MENRNFSMYIQEEIRRE